VKNNYSVGHGFTVIVLNQPTRPLDAKPYANHDAFRDAALTAGVFSSIYYHYMFSENL
jgi:hypothetical protein